MPEKLPHKRVLGEEEFGRLFNKCRIPFTTVANSYVHDAAVAEDLVNDSFVRLWEKRNEILTENFEAYLFQIVIRKCLDFLRSEQTQTKIRQNIHDTSYRMLTYEINSLESCDPGRLYASEVETLFRECIDHMPSITREVFLANRFRNMTYQEIAEERGMSVRQVTSEMQTALQLLRRTLKDYLPLALMLLLHR
jgi:RNA polymerase sigma factor, sigma-70 family/RNA polymerase sigma-70 factor, Bacteroides expansion family 1